MRANPLLLLVALLANWEADATEFGGMIGNRESPEFRNRLETEGDIRWYRTLGYLPADSKPKEQSVEFPAGIPTWSPEVRILVHSYPDDLRAVFAAARSLASRKPQVDAWEIGNEMEFIFSRDLPDLVAAATKAARLGLRAGGARGRILMPSLAFRPGPYAQELVANGIPRWTDGWNVHFYSWSQDFVGNLREHRRLLRDSGAPDLPLWLTEVGTLEMPGDGTRPPRLLLERQAVFFERTAVEAWMLGVAGYGAFTFSPYVQGPLDLGLTEADRSPRPALQRFLHLTRTLPDCKPLHWLREERTGADVGVVLRRPDGLWWTLLWTPNRRTEEDLPPPTEYEPPDMASRNSAFALEVRPPIGAKVGTAPGSLENFDPARHSQLIVSAATNYHLVSKPGPFQIQGVRWEPWRNESRPSKPPEPGPVVLQWRIPGSRPDRDGLCHRIPVRDAVPLQLIAYNFSGRPVSGRWHVTAPRGWRVVSGDSGRTRIPADGMATNQILLAPTTPVHSQERTVVRAEWKSGWNPSDVASVTLAAEPTESEPTEPVPWNPTWQSDSDTYRWKAEPCPDGLMRLGLFQVNGSGPLPGLVAALPDDFEPRATDVLRVRIRNHAGHPVESVRVEFVTRGRIVTGLTRNRPGESPVWTGDFRIGDAESGFWSRADPERKSHPGDVRWVQLQFLGISTTSRFDLLSVDLLRVPR